ncbi:Tyrosine recombinase XerC [subsurface metagenome]
MKVVQPIRDYNKVQAIKANLKKRSARDYLLFVLGITSGLRIGDLLKLRVKDVKNRDGSLKNVLIFIEGKTKKPRELALTKNTKEAMQNFFDKTGIFEHDKYLFTSNKSLGNKPLTGVRVYQMMNDWCSEVNINYSVGTHTLRKTAGYMMRTRGGIAIEVISEVLGHSNLKVTSRYIGITQDEIKEKLKGFDL